MVFNIGNKYQHFAIEFFENILFLKITTIFFFFFNRELEAKFKVPVYDRYMLVIQIFREHAVSKEAKLQVALAEIPYLR